MVKMGRGNCTGQSGLELIIGLSIIAMVFAIVVLIVMDKTAESSTVKTALDVMRVASSVKDNVDMIQGQGPGYYSYFSVPEQIQGGYDYDLIFGGNILELTWGEQTWSTKLAASNITVFCLSRGLDKKNRIRYGDDGLEVTCHLPNLAVLQGTLVLNPGNTTVDVVDDSHVDSPYFRTLFETNGSQETVVTSGLGAGQSATLTFNHQAVDYVRITTDYFNDVNESIEGDNNFTGYI